MPLSRLLAGIAPLTPFLALGSCRQAVWSRARRLFRSQRATFGPLFGS